MNYSYIYYKKREKPGPEGVCARQKIFKSTFRVSSQISVDLHIYVSGKFDNIDKSVAKIVFFDSPDRSIQLSGYLGIKARKSRLSGKLMFQFRVTEHTYI